MTTIEDIILRFDKRGMTPLRPHLAADYCTRAARCILDAPGRALIATGFYITRAGATETDGPPGAYFIGRALEALGRPITYVTDRYTTHLFEGFAEPEDIVDFPITDAKLPARPSPWTCWSGSSRPWPSPSSGAGSPGRAAT